MKISPNPTNETDRLRALKQLQILDTEAEKDFDDLVRLASLICNTKMSLIGLIDENRQWYKARIGVEDTEVSRELSFCSHAIHNDEIMQVPDATKDDRFYDHPFVTTEPGIRFYASVPLMTTEGYGLGTLCVFDHKPKILTPDQLIALRILGNQVMKLLDLRTRMIELKEARLKAEEASKVKSNFLSVMSHEIRTPMNAMVGLTSLLLDESPTDAQQEYLTLLKFSGENLLTIINDILDFNKIEANKVVIENINVILPDLVDKIFKMFRVRAEDKRVELKLNFDAALPRFIKTDPVRLTQVLTNVVSNAIKFTERGVVALSVQHLGVSNNHHQIRFEIKDSGIGITPDKLQMIFEPFVQADTDTTRKFGGTGLGLSISRNILSLMNSEFKVESVPGKGSSFSFVLSVAEGEKAMEWASPKALKSLTGNVLVVDDNEVNQLVAQRILKKWNINTIAAGSGLDAIVKVSNNVFDLILMDIQMPDIDGFETTRRIRELGIQTPIIALTASSIEEIQAEAVRSGMADFISKPFEPAKMHNVIAEYLL